MVKSGLETHDELKVITVFHLIGLALELSVPLAVSVYLNFFTHHFIWDIRWFLTAAIFVVFWRSRVRFRVAEEWFHIPLSLAFLLIGFFIWIAENIATLLGAWRYPNQQTGWELVHLSKISSWFLLVIVSFIIVAQLKNLKTNLRSRSTHQEIVEHS